MQLKSLSHSQLRVNPANDRHGELADEPSAIAWLLHNRSAHMKNLAKDIAENGRVFEPPLVVKNGSKYVVYDGNRRSACVKLLNNPKLAPSAEWQAFFSKLSQKHNAPKTVLCQIEASLEDVDEMLYRRHTGAQSGVGQLEWDATAKSNFKARTGKNTRISLAEEVEALLKTRGMIPQNARLPRSNLDRLLSAEPLRNRVGLSVRRNSVEFTHNEDKVLSALKRIADDLISKNIVLGDIWNHEDKKKYMDRLDKDGVLPTINHALDQHIPISSAKTKSKGTPREAAKSAQRTALIPHNIEYGIIIKQHTRRIMAIWDELQNHLKFGHHDNAIAVLFRTMLELCIDNYIKQKNVSCHENDSLANKFKKCADHMRSTGAIEKDYYDGIKKFPQSDHILSANTLNKYVHSKTFFASEQHVKSMWDNLEGFILECIKA